MYLSMSTKAPTSDVKEIDRLRSLKNLSRAEYIRAALENYNTNPQKPSFTRGHNYSKGEEMSPLTLFLEQKHIDIITKYQTIFKATKVQIIRQAVIQEAEQDGQTFKTIIPPIDPSLVNIWVKASDIYTLLGIHRNNIYRAAKIAGIESKSGIKISRHPEKWYRLRDIIKIYRLDESKSEHLKGYGICFYPAEPE